MERMKAIRWRVRLFLAWVPTTFYLVIRILLLLPPNTYISRDCQAIRMLWIIPIVTLGVLGAWWRHDQIARNPELTWVWWGDNDLDEVDRFWLELRNGLLIAGVSIAVLEAIIRIMFHYLCGR